MQQHIIAAKPIKTTDKQAPVTATECTASTSQVEPAATEAGSPAPQVVEPLTSESDTPSPQERVDTTPNVEESDSSISPTKTSLHKSSGNLSDFFETGTFIFPTMLYTYMYVAQPIICYESSVATDSSVNNTLFLQTHCFWKWRWKT